MTFIHQFLLSIAVFLLFQTQVYAQNDTELDQVIAELIAAFIENSGEEGEFDFNTLYEQYDVLRDRPINLNKATRPDLQELFFLSEIQISNFLDHRNKLGSLKNILELQTIPSFDLATIRLLKEVSVVNKSIEVYKKSVLSQLNSANHTLFLKWKRVVQEQRGFTSLDGEDPAFVGSPDHLYLRYKMNIGNDFKLGFIAEKDAGEPFYYPGKVYGADYFSFHAYVRDLTTRIRFLALGDYSISLGQGLIMHNGFGTGKSSLTTSVRKGGYPIRAYTSVAELNFLRGAAATIKLTDNVEWTNFISSKFRNGGIQVEEDDPFLGNYVSSLPLGGLNRTESEIARKNTIRQETGGSSLKYRFRKGHIAAQGIVDRFNYPIVPSDQLYQKFFPSGKVLWNASVDYGYNWRNLNFFGEIATDKNFSTAQMHGLIVGLDKTLDFVVCYRNYDRAYRSLSANSFGESPLATNERGFYLGIEFRPSKMWIINAYADHWQNQWAKFRVDGPGTGQEYFLKIKYFKKRSWELYTQYFFEQKPRNFDAEIDAPLDNIRQRFRLHGAIKMSKAIELRNRIEFSWYNIASQINYNGFMLYQDFVYKPVGKNYSFTGRYAYFDIENFDARIYAYENDILNEYYIPAYNGRGLRFYLNTRIRVNKHITAEGRYEVVRLSAPFKDINGDYTNNKFGSGNTLIEGDTRSQVKAQIKYSF